MSSDRAKLDQLIGCSVFNKFSKTSRHYNGVNDMLGLHGFYPAIEHWRGGKLLDTYQIHNDIVVVGKNMILNVMFKDATVSPSANWAVGLIQNDAFGGFSESDTLATHSWTEFTNYTIPPTDNTKRAPWGQGTATAKTITNATPATFDITVVSNFSLKGIFICDQPTKGALSPGTLWATGQFAALVPVSAGDQMKITYTVSS